MAAPIAPPPPPSADSDTFTLLPLRMDPTSKAISSTVPNSTLSPELEALNLLHRSFLTTPSSHPPPPMPVDPKRSAQVAKLRESGNTEFRKGKHHDAIRIYSLGIEMALKRPSWEPLKMVQEDLAGLYANRAQAYMALQMWVEGARDAELSVESRRQGNAKAWWRRGKCLVEMGRGREAREWVGKGLEVEGDEADLVGLAKEIEKREGKEGGEE